MSVSSEPPSGNRVTSLKILCQRVAANHLLAIENLGDMSYGIVEPILERCDAARLRQLEEASPQLKEGTQGLWQKLCRERFPLYVDNGETISDSKPECWREHFYSLQLFEEQRMAAVGERVRLQRYEAEGQKKDRETKYINCLPPAQKRARTWGNAQPQTIVQKLRSNTYKIQKGMLTAPKRSPTMIRKDCRVGSAKSSLNLLPPAPSDASGRVTVNTVLKPRPSTSVSKLGNSSALPLPKDPPGPAATRVNWIPKPELSARSADIPKHHQSQAPSISRVPKAKKDPTACLFMPKSRAYSQLNGR